MMEFDLVDQDGNEITALALSETAEVCMKATSGLELGNVVPLWYYDEQAGLWKEEGQGTVENRDGELQICGRVAHFTWWNYDQPISTHSCMKYSIESESNDADLDGLAWYVEGVTYNGTSPSRVCSNDGGNTDFDSFTVKITTDIDNPEQIKVYTNIGGSKFYLSDDGDNTYSLTQLTADAAIFNTPSVQGSCLSNSQSGTCMNLDHQSDDNGILPLTADVNLPPVIMEFSVSSGTLLPGETADVKATVTDPENSVVTLDWSVNCGYYGNTNGSEFMTPASDSGPSGEQFTAVMTAPDTLSYPIEYCKIELVAMDDEGLFSTANRWVPVAASFEFEVSGVLYDTDGLPYANQILDYVNYNCMDGVDLQDSTVTDASGNYRFNINLASCIDEFQGYGDFGAILVSYEHFGSPWSTEFRIDNSYYGEGENGTLTECSVVADGTTVCEFDLHLPVLWGPVSGEVYMPDDIESADISYFYMNTSFYDFGAHSSFGGNNLLDLTNSVDAFGPIMAPVGDLHVGHSYRIADEWNYQNNNVHNYSTDGSVVDLGNLQTTVPVVVTVFDVNNAPLPDINISFTSRFWNNNDGGEIDLSGTTDSNGEFMADAYLGYLNVSSSNPSNYFYGNVSSVSGTKYIDLDSTLSCVVEGKFVDVFGEPIANEEFTTYYNSNSIDFMTDENGNYSITVVPMVIIISQVLITRPIIIVMRM
ncbi:hypothetical protein RS130_21030 [Paraglaciecola aquimarina]|uniref:Big-1 domain-containing protein n=1 Tax=Paraglaciecola aquimarina TaxID=1235557 RepID=A0ABU3T1E7_9ALTE|nr:hypothetical protein [Paraglaciecola aquimarina]MDU0356042.1 hypothetical protein [Paraglaciecola aquimarina]